MSPSAGQDPRLYISGNFDNGLQNFGNASVTGWGGCHSEGIFFESKSIVISKKDSS